MKRGVSSWDLTSSFTLVLGSKPACSSQQDAGPLMDSADHTDAEESGLDKALLAQEENTETCFWMWIPAQPYPSFGPTLVIPVSERRQDWLDGMLRSLTWSSYDLSLPCSHSGHSLISGVLTELT